MNLNMALSLERAAMHQSQHAFLVFKNKCILLSIGNVLLFIYKINLLNENRYN